MRLPALQHRTAREGNLVAKVVGTASFVRAGRWPPRPVDGTDEPAASSPPSHRAAKQSGVEEPSLVEKVGGQRRSRGVAVPAEASQEASGVPTQADPRQADSRTEHDKVLRAGLALPAQGASPMLAGLARDKRDGRRTRPHRLGGPLEGTVPLALGSR